LGVKRAFLKIIAANSLLCKTECGVVDVPAITCYAWGRHDEILKSLGDFNAREPLETRNPYLFALLLTVLFLGVSFFGGALLKVLAYPVLAIIAALFVTKKHLWRRIGFTYSGTNRRSFLLFTPVFADVLWWLAIAPMMGYGTLRSPESALYY
jgi:hypothetical protein